MRGLRVLMLFNSPIFLFAFLPATFAMFFLLARASAVLARAWLAAASLFFYAWWNPPYLLLLLFSAGVNYGIGLPLRRSGINPATRKLLLWCGIAFNLLVLGYFKYFAFLASIVTGYPPPLPGEGGILLPLAISFFTFQKIAFLADSYGGRIKDGTVLDYLLFVSFFPQLIAGPIVHYNEVVPQYRDPRIYRINADNVAEGLAVFLLGLAKKVVLADTLARYADAGFGSAAAGIELSLVVAWMATIAYALQLYFDFSGYSDMAVGLARMFNVKLPLNFDAPYQATNIIEFWRRWHMTLSRFLRDYVYIPLGGNRHGVARRYMNVMLTMVIGGIWHGAGWTFLLWGALHGLYLLVNHFWRARVGSLGMGRLGLAASCTVTLIAVLFAWVPFRAADLTTAIDIYRGMLGFNGAVLPNQILDLIPILRTCFEGMTVLPGMPDQTVMGFVDGCVLIALGIAVALAGRPVHRMTERARLVTIVLSFGFVVQKVIFSPDIAPFLYFQF